MTPKELVVAYMEQVWVGQDVAALDRFIAADLIQHNPHLPNGPQALSDFLPTNTLRQIDARPGHPARPIPPSSAPGRKS